MLIYILILIIAILVLILMSKRGRDEAMGICEVVLEKEGERRENLNKILELFASKNISKNVSGQPDEMQVAELSNFEIREALGFPSRTIVRYMDLLEKEGKVEQLGAVGYAVTYRLKTSAQPSTQPINHQSNLV